MKITSANNEKEYLFQSMIDAIGTGKFPPRSPLPSIREIEKEFNVNRNTAYNLYKRLEEQGYIYSVQGRGFFVADEPPQTNKWSDSLESYLQPLILSAKFAGLSQESLVHSVTEYIRENYQKNHISIAFLECNAFESQQIAKDIETQIGIEVHPYVIDQVRETKNTLPSYDFILTTLFHINEVESLFEGREVLGLHHNFSLETVDQIARLDAKDLCIIATNERTLSALKGIVSIFHHKIKYAITADDEIVQETISQSDVIIVNPEVLTRLSLLDLHSNVITVQFQIETHSIKYLKDRLYEMEQKNRVAK